MLTVFVSVAGSRLHLSFVKVLVNVNSTVSRSQVYRSCTRPQIHTTPAVGIDKNEMLTNILEKKDPPQ